MRPASLHVSSSGILLLFVAVTSSPAAPIVPAALNPGDPYHLAFVTQGVGTALSSDIEVYNQFVNDEAALNPALTGTDAGVEWFVIGSTGDVAARDNALVGADVPIYLLDGVTKIADGFGDLWDTTIDNPFNKDQFLNPSGGETLTGTDSSGFRATNYDFPAWLGAIGPVASVQTGCSNACTNSRWIVFTNRKTDVLLPYYALSEELTVVPEPSAVILAALSLMGLVAYVWRRRRRA